MNDRSNLRSLVIGAGGDAFIILTAIFAVLLVTANFQPSGKPSRQELKKQNEKLEKKLQAAQKRLKELGIELTGSSSGGSPSKEAIYVYVRSGGEIVVEKGATTRSATGETLPETLNQLGGSKMVLLAEPGVPSGRITRLVSKAKGALPGASTSLGTLEK